MTSTVNLFLRPLPSGASYYREAHAYGPTAAGPFNTDLAIEVDPGQLDPFAKVRAAVGGVIRYIPGPAAAPGVLVLRPDPTVLSDLGATLGMKASLVFVYRNLDPTAVTTALTPIIQAAGDAPFLLPGTPAQRAASFVKGDFALSVSAGVDLGTASTTGGTGGWALVGFEIVFVPGGLGPDAGGGAAAWTRLKELIDPTAPTRRLDPVAFYDGLVGAAGPALLATADVGHSYDAQQTRRTIIEIRDEYDLPFVGPVTITEGGTATTVTPPAASRGTIEVDVAPAVGPVQQITYAVSVADRLLTDLPSGTAARPSPSRTLMSPAHWAVQAIVMVQSPSTANEPDSWFVANTMSLPRFTENNLVTPLRDGIATFREYTAAIRTLTAQGHRMCLAAWRLMDGFPLVDGDATSTMLELTRAAATAGADVYALAWDQAGTANTAEVNRINALPGGRGHAILDNDTLNLGAHHQKLLVIDGSQGAYAFCGGIDVNSDRRDSPNHGATGAFHDVHAKVEGPAVADLYRTFALRWNAHPNRPTAVALPIAAPPFRANAGTHAVQVACTYPPSKAYSFAPTGSLVPLNAFRRAIQKAKKFIYIEDQYLTPYPGTQPATGGGDTVGVLTDLRAALARIDYLVIVIPNHGDQPQQRYRRQQFIEGLRAVNPAKVHVFFLGRQGPRPGPGEVATEGGCSSCSGGPSFRNEIYIHTKVWIVDDVAVKIGSANQNRRGYTHDSELDIVAVDAALENGGRAFARRLRLQLWGEHLNLPGAASAVLEDYRHALGYWTSLPPGARIRPYLHNTEIETIHTQGSWNIAVDPDGR